MDMNMINEAVKNYTSTSSQLMNGQLSENFEEMLYELGKEVDILKKDFILEENDKVLFLEQTKYLNKATTEEDKQCYFKKGSKITTGDIIKLIDFDKSTEDEKIYKKSYIATGFVEDDFSVNFVRVVRLNHVLKFKDKLTNRLIEQPCVLEINVKTEGDYTFGKYAWEGDKEYRVIMPNNDNTKIICRQYKFVIDNLVYQNTAYDRVASPNEGLFVFRLREVLSDHLSDFENKYENIDSKLSLDIEPFEIKKDSTYIPKPFILKDGEVQQGVLYEKFLVENIEESDKIEILENGSIKAIEEGRVKLKISWEENLNISKIIEIEVVPSQEVLDIKSYAIEGSSKAYSNNNNKYIPTVYLNGKKIDSNYMNGEYEYELLINTNKIIIKDGYIINPNTSLLGKKFRLDMIERNINTKEEKIVATKEIKVVV